MNDPSPRHTAKMRTEYQWWGRGSRTTRNAGDGRMPRSWSRRIVLLDRSHRTATHDGAMQPTCSSRRSCFLRRTDLLPHSPTMFLPHATLRFAWNHRCYDERAGLLRLEGPRWPRQGTWCVQGEDCSGICHRPTPSDATGDPSQDATVLFWHDACAVTTSRSAPKKIEKFLAPRDVMRARGGLVWHDATVLPHQMQPDSKVRCHRPAI